jgi:hypothetical protein
MLQPVGFHKWIRQVDHRLKSLFGGSNSAGQRLNRLRKKIV